MATSLVLRNPRARRQPLIRLPVACRSFDEDHHLRAEFAKKNLYIRDDRPGMQRQNGGGGGYEPYRKKYRRDENADNPPSTTLFVGNLSSEVDSGEVKAFFSKFKVN